jgi:hypothetical protein
MPEKELSAHTFPVLILVGGLDLVKIMLAPDWTARFAFEPVYNPNMRLCALASDSTGVAALVAGEFPRSARYSGSSIFDDSFAAAVTALQAAAKERMKRQVLEELEEKNTMAVIGELEKILAM